MLDLIVHKVGKFDTFATFTITIATDFVSKLVYLDNDVFIKLSPVFILLHPIVQKRLLYPKHFNSDWKAERTPPARLSRSRKIAFPD
jgi:hypothetical protein